MPKQNYNKAESRPGGTGGKYEQNSVDKKTITKPLKSESMPTKK